MRKLITYYWYLYEYLKFWDFKSIYASLNYLILKKSHPSDRIINTTTGKYFCRKNTNDFQFANFRYEWNVKKFIINNLHSFDAFIDAGACIGEYGIWLSQVGKKSICFEPMPVNYQVINRNLELNNLQDKMVVFPFGLANANEDIPFKFNPVNTGASHFLHSSNQKETRVPVRKLDFLSPELNLDAKAKVLFKIDVEGMEVEVIKGAENFIKSRPDLLFIIEVKHAGKQRIMETLNAICKFEIDDIDEFNIYAKKIN